MTKRNLSATDHGRHADIKRGFEAAYDALKCVLMSDLQGNWSAQEPHSRYIWLGNRLDHTEMLKKACDLRAYIKKYPDGIDGISKTQFVKAKAFLLGALEIIGVFYEEDTEELLKGEKIWLEDADQLLTENNEDAIELALANLWMCLQAIEECYRRGSYSKAMSSVKEIKRLLTRHIADPEGLLSLLMLGLTEKTVLSMKRLLEKLRFKKGRNQAFVGRGTRNSHDSIWGFIAESAPRYSEDLLSLLGLLGLMEGKIHIRLSGFALADEALEQCLRATSAWYQLKLQRLAKEMQERQAALRHSGGTKNTRSKGVRRSVDENLAQESTRTENFALYRMAVAQCYLSYSSYRRGEFRRALTQVLPARLTLNRSCWIFSRIFADMIQAGAERRLAGIHNEEHLIEAKELCENTVVFFDPNILAGAKSYTAKRIEGGGVLNTGFLLRACYEIGISYYYLAEIREHYLDNIKKSEAKDEHHLIDDVKEELRRFVKEADRYSEIIMSHTTGANLVDAFWLANARHLKSFVAMRETIRPGKNKQQEIERAFNNAIELIKEAVAAAKQSESKWQQTEILSDQAYILNKTAWFYEKQAQRAKEKQRLINRDDGERNRSSKRKPNKEEIIHDSNKAPDEVFHLLGGERQLTERKRALAREALKRLEEALAVAEQMAREEGLVEPRPNFSGPIYLFQADSHALLGSKSRAQEFYSKWVKVSNGVEYSRIIDLSEEVKRRIEGVDQTKVFSREGGLNFNDHDKALKQWLLEQALEEAGSDAGAIRLLGVSKATFYAWKNKFAAEAKEAHSKNR